MRKQFIYVTSPICAAIIVAGAWLVNAGPPALNPPPGPVGVSGRFGTRTAITSLPFTINQCGSYFLTDCLTGVAGQDGITIDADDVTLDLNGFSLVGVPGSLDGVAVSAARTNLAIRNGTVRDWGGDGVDGFTAKNSQLENLRASDNGGYGLRIGFGSTVTNCTATGNTIHGMSTSAGCTIVNCSAASNLLSGISVGSGCTVRSCTVKSNGDVGIDASSRCTVISCTADGNGNVAGAVSKDGILVGTGSSVIDCTAALNGNNGIVVPGGTASCTIRGCTVSFNTVDGIEAPSDCHIVGNSCMSNGIFVGGAGIHTTGDDNRIEGNNVTDNTRGIDVDGADSIIIKNTASGNTTNYTIAADNRYGPIINITAAGQPAVSGSSAAGTVVTTDPWANFAY